MNTILKEKWRENLAKNILLERKRLNLSQIALAKKLGAKEGSTVSFWENGKGEFNIGTLMKLCFEFNRLPNDLLMSVLGDSNPPPKKNLWEDDSEELEEKEGGGQKKPATALPEEDEPPQKEGHDARILAVEQKAIDLLLELRELRAN
jgi:transcriptional regulator with XRE-family HTH domain